MKVWNMKKYLVFSLIVALLLVSTACKVDNSNSGSLIENKSILSKEVTEELNNVISANKFNGVACIYYDGSKIFESTTGYSDNQNNTLNDAEATFRLGSITKQFTATGVCILCEEGKLNLEDTIDKFFDNYQYGNKITVKHLLNMTSGIPDYITDENTITKTEKSLEFNVSKTNTDEKNKSAIEEWIFSQSLSFDPGTNMEYSNSNYFLLGKIIELVSGMDYHSFIQEKIIKKIGLANTGFDDKILTTKGYKYDSVATEEECLNELGWEWLYYPGVVFACADLISSVDDLHVWLEQLRNGNIIGKDMLELMFENNSFHYGFGFFNSNIASNHGGHVGCYDTYIGFSNNIEVIVLSNCFYDRAISSDIGDGLGTIVSNNLSD